jgi:subtilase family serine protease
MISIGGGHNDVIFSGTAAQVQHAFGAAIHNYEVGGVQHFANSTPVRMPAALAGIVTGVMGLHDFRPLPANGGKPFGAMRTRPQYYDGDFLFPNFLAPGDIYTIYDIPASMDGSGQTLAIVGQTDVYLADINDFRSGFGLSTISTGDCSTDANGIIIPPCTDPLFHYVLNGPDGGVSYDDIPEADLDLEWSGATAQSVQVVYVNSGGTANGVYDALTAAINPPSGPPLSTVISMSYGYCEIGAPDLESLLAQGNAEGVTIMNSAGDVGSAACDYDPPNGIQPYSPAVYGLAVSYPASSQYVTGVGGTAISLANDSYPTQSPYWSTTIGANGGTAVSYIPETPWNDDEEFASYCHSPARGDTFCSTGGGTDGWVALGSSATAAQVQEDIWISQGGGGASNCWYPNEEDTECGGPGPYPTGGGFPQPQYQQGLSVPGAPSGALAVRYVPDVSMHASPDFPGYILCTPVFVVEGGDDTASTCAGGIFDAVDTYESIFGGTSASSPVFAGIVALVNQYMIAKGEQAEPGLGNINSALYSLAASNSINHVFHQITTGDNMVYCQVGEPAGEPSNIVCPSAGVFGWEASNADPTTGYNLVTGLGSVDADKLAVAYADLELSSTTTTLVSSLNPASVGASVTFTATVSTTGSNPPTGTVTFYNGATSLGAETLGTVGGAQVATLTTSSLPAGSDSITAVYGGDSNNAGSTSSVLIQVINGDATTTALTSSLNPAGDGVSVTFTAKVTTTGTHVPTGTVSFENGGVIFGSPVTLTALNGTQATAAITTSTLPVGTDSITAVYSGDSNNGGSTSNTVSQVINPPTFIFSTEPSAPAAVFSGGFTTSTFTLTPGGGTFAQAVTFACTGSSLPAATSCGFSPTQIAAGAGATQVTLTIQTTGPNADVQGGIRRRADNRSPVLPFALPLAGIVAAGFAGRKFWRHSAWAGLGVSLLLLGLLIACGGGSSTPPITITVSPSAVTLYPNDAADSWPPQTATFTATVTNTNNSAVTWAVTTTNGGTISAGGVYTAPTIASGLPTTATIMATSQADTTKTATAVVNITPTTVPGTYPGITVTATEGPTVNTSSAISLTVN